MKKFIIGSVLIFHVVIIFSACKTVKEVVVEADYNSSSFTGDSESYDASLSGTSASVSGSIEIGPSGSADDGLYKISSENIGLSFRPGIGFSMQGSKYTDVILGQTTKGNVRVNYIVFPMLFNYLMRSGFYVEGGVQPAIRVTAKDNYGGNSYDYKSHIGGFDFGIPVGIGFQFNNGLGIGGRVIPGIVNIDKVGGSAKRNFVLQFGLKYLFSVSGKDK